MLDLHFIVAAQWQGSGSTRALHLFDGAHVIQGDLPTAKTTIIDIPLGAGESLGSGVRRLSSLQNVRDRVAEALSGLSVPAITVGGDCGVELAPVAHAHAVHPGDLALVWFDAHPDLNTPESSPSGAFHGMVLRSILGEGDPSLSLENPLPLSNVILAGTRAFDEPEAQWVTENGLHVISPNDVAGESLVNALRATGAKHVYIHIDVDVLDPAEFTSLDFPEPFGVSLTALLESIRAVRAEFTFAGAGVCEFAPSTPDAASDDVPSMLRIIGALTS